MSAYPGMCQNGHHRRDIALIPTDAGGRCPLCWWTQTSTSGADDRTDETEDQG